MTKSEFHAQNKVDWASMIHSSFGATPPQSSVWTEIGDIVNVLQPFMKIGFNHTMLPTGGGLDMMRVSLCSEDDCIDFLPDENLYYRCRPAKLHFEYFSESKWNSFFLIDCLPLAPEGVTAERDVEELVEVSPGRFVNSSHYDSEEFEQEEDGDKNTPEFQRRYVSRFLRGKFLVVAKCSIWNRVNSTYDGRHNLMDCQQIRAQIQAAVDRMKS